MGLDDFSRKLENTIGKIKRKTKSTEKVLDELEELYQDSIDGIDEMIRWLNYYTNDPEHVEYDPLDNKVIPEYKLVSLNNAVSDAPKLVSGPYRKFRKEKPLITGDELPSNMRDGYRTNEWTRFCKSVKEHKSFLIQMKKVLREGLDDVKDSKKELNRRNYDEKSARQRGKSARNNSKDVKPEVTPESVRNQLSEMVNEEVSEPEKENKEDEENEDSEEDIRLMEPRQFVHYLVEYLKHDQRERSDYYWILKDGFPEQSSKIESKVHSINDIRKIGDDEDIRPLSPEEIKYVKDRVRNGKQMNETLESYKEK